MKAFKQPALFIGGQQRSGFLGIHIKTLGDGFRSVVGTAFDLGTLLHALHKHVMVSVESHHSVQRSVQIGEDGVQCLNLGALRG